MSSHLNVIHTSRNTLIRSEKNLENCTAEKWDLANGSLQLIQKVLLASLDIYTDTLSLNLSVRSFRSCGYLTSHSRVHEIYTDFFPLVIALFMPYFIKFLIELFYSLFYICCNLKIVELFPCV